MMTALVGGAACEWGVTGCVTRGCPNFHPVLPKGNYVSVPDFDVSISAAGCRNNAAAFRQGFIEELDTWIPLWVVVCADCAGGGEWMLSWTSRLYVWESPAYFSLTPSSFISSTSRSTWTATGSTSTPSPVMTSASRYVYVQVSRSKSCVRWKHDYAKK